MKDTTKIVLVSFAAAALVILLIVLLIKKHEAQQACIESGGTIHEYNCTMVSCGKGCFTESCDWQCIGGQP